MDYQFSHNRFRQRRDALEATRVNHTKHSLANRRKVVDWVDLTCDYDKNPERRELWKLMLGPDYKINHVHLGNKPRNAFVDRLLADGRVDIAEFFMKMLVGYNRTGWTFDKELNLIRPLDSIFVGPAFDVISTFFFCKYDPEIEAEPLDCVDLHVAYVHVTHPFYQIMMSSLADMYKRRPNLESKYYTGRFLSGFLLYHNFQPKSMINFTEKAMAIMPFFYFPELEIPPEAYASQMNFYGYVLKS